MGASAAAISEDGDLDIEAVASEQVYGIPGISQNINHNSLHDFHLAMLSNLGKTRRE